MTNAVKTISITSKKELPTIDVPSFRWHKSANKAIRNRRARFPGQNISHLTIRLPCNISITASEANHESFNILENNRYNNDESNTLLSSKNTILVAKSPIPVN